MDKETIKKNSELVFNIEKEVSKVYVGKEAHIRMLFIGLFSGLHVLIEDIPGVGKTTLAKSVAKSIGLDFGRIQFTPDLLPGDILGMNIWSFEKREFIFKHGAIMHQFILADELNRASPRTQASLLEAMQEEQITVDGKTYKLKKPFFVLATQNPVTFIGSFLLPEAQVDRFGLTITLGYLPEHEEAQMLERFQEKDPMTEISNVASPEVIEEIRQLVRQVHIDPQIHNYIVQIGQKTRQSRYIKLGLSPRALQHLLLASQTRAFLEQREFVMPEDVIKTSEAVLSHRLVLTSEAKLEDKTSEIIIRSILNSVPKPTGIKTK